MTRLFLRAISYLALGVIVLVVAGVGVRKQMDRQHGSAGRLPAKMSYYADARTTYDVVFVGDSRTLCDFHPELLDPALGTHSYNLGHWTNWLPTQYAEIEDLLDILPQNTIVVWSIGHENFLQEPIEPAYPIGWRRVPNYLSRGFSLGELAGDLAEFTPGPNLYTLRPRLMQSVDAALDRPIRPGGATEVSVAEPPLLVASRANPAIDHFDYYYDSTALASVGANFKNGSYLRYELDPAFYRAKQKELAAEAKTSVAGRHFEPDQRYWSLFVSILDMFARHHIHVVVNVLEEAPGMYGAGSWHQETRAFMDGPVRREVEARDIPFVSVDFDRLTDADYFDHNHLNSVGVPHFTAMVAPLLRDAMARWR